MPKHIKRVRYNGRHPALLVDGKFVGMMVQHILKTDSNPPLSLPVYDVYFMHEGILYKALGVPNVVSVGPEMTFIPFMIDRILNPTGSQHVIPYSACKSIREAFISIEKMGERIKRSNIQILTDYAVLVHVPSINFIEVTYGTYTGTHYEILQYDTGEYRYGMSADSNLQAMEYPDMEDSSTCMNLMLGGAKVQHMKELVEVFEEYTKNKVRYV